MIQNDVFVFDNAIHMYDLSDENLKREDSNFDRQWHLRMGQHFRQTASSDFYANWNPLSGFARKWTAEDLGRLLFENSGTDMAMAQGVPGFMGPDSKSWYIRWNDQGRNSAESTNPLCPLSGRPKDLESRSR